MCSLSNDKEGKECQAITTKICRTHRVLAGNPGNIDLFSGAVVGNADSYHRVLSYRRHVMACCLKIIPAVALARVIPDGQVRQRDLPRLSQRANHRSHVIMMPKAAAARQPPACVLFRGFRPPAQEAAKLQPLRITTELPLCSLDVGLPPPSGLPQVACDFPKVDFFMNSFSVQD
jgi:hypothetical protein